MLKAIFKNDQVMMKQRLSEAKNVSMNAIDRNLEENFKQCELMK